MGFLQKRLTPRPWASYMLAGVLIAFSEPTPGALLGGGLLVGLGEVLRIWATGHLVKTERLTITGPYRYLRHPLYMGTLLIGVGFCVMGANAVALGLLAGFVLVFLGYYMPYKNRIEGARLEARYGDAFCRYATAVPRLLPRLRPYHALAGDAEEQGSWRAQRFVENNELGTTVVVALGVVAMSLRRSLF